MIVLGIDPGSLKTGYALLESGGREPVLMASGVIKLPSNYKIGDRLAQLHEALKTLILDHAPRQLAIENIFTHQNVQSTLKLGQARGVCILTGAQAKLEIREYAPLEIKQAMTGYGLSGKEQVATMVRRLLNIPHAMDRDQSDAIAVALTHHYRSRYRERMSSRRLS